MPSPSGKSFLLILLPFYCTPILSFLYRMLNALIAQELVAEFGLSPAELGLITGSFFFGFGAMQLPLGVLLDRYGPRPVIITLYLVATAGAAIFMLAPDPVWLIAGRFLIGLGVAGSMMSGLKATRIWAPADRLPFITASLFAMTGVGGMIGTAPMGMLIAEVGWRGGLLAIMGYSAMLMLFIAIRVPSAPGPAGVTWGSSFRELSGVLRSPLVWLVAPTSIASVGVNSAYLSLWAPIWLRDVAGFGQSAQEWSLFAYMATTMAGMLAAGYISQTLMKRGISLLWVVFSGMGIAMLAQVLALFELTAIAWLIWPLFALGSASTVTLFAWLVRHFDPTVAGRVNTTLNFLMFAGAFAAQWGVGIIINQFTPPAGGGYSLAAHWTALAVMLGIQLAALLWYVLRLRQMIPQLRTNQT